MKWLDSRVHKPSSNRFDKYTVAFLFPITGSVLLGQASWMPKDQYTDGDWIELTFMNGNPVEGEVLYWMPHPKIPTLEQL